MKKSLVSAMLLGLGLFVVGCEKTPDDKRADAQKKSIQADADAKKASADAGAKKADAAKDARDADADAKREAR